MVPRTIALVPRAARHPLLAVVALVLTGCAALTTSPPVPTPVDFPGLAGVLAQNGILVTDFVSGDPGCDDPTLAPTAIRFEMSGYEIVTPVLARVFIFRNREAYERRRADVDACALAWPGDPSTIESVDASPFVIVGAGPWPAEFKRALRNGLVEAAGNGG